MTADRAKEKFFRLTGEQDGRLAKLVQYAHKRGYIRKASLQDFMEFAIACADSALKQDFGSVEPAETGTAQAAPAKKRQHYLG